MINKRNIKQQISQVASLKDLTKIYAEVASLRMKKTRDSVLTSRDYLHELNAIFDEVHYHYASEIKRLAAGRSKNKSEVTFLSHNGKNVVLLLSSNSGLYGDIVPRTFQMFLNKVREGGSEVVIAGRQGLQMFLANEPNRPYTYFDFPDKTAASLNLIDLISHVVQYERINIFYGKFYNLIDQRPDVVTISSHTAITAPPTGKRVEYIFEPNLQKILIFFETEIFASLFEQTVRESELARFASRMISMQQAEQNINKYLTFLKLQQVRFNHAEANKKQLNSISSVYFLNGNNGY